MDNNTNSSKVPPLGPTALWMQLNQMLNVLIQAILQKSATHLMKELFTILLISNE